MVLSRENLRKLLLVSLLVSLVLHVLFFLATPRIKMYSAGKLTQQARKMFKLKELEVKKLPRQFIGRIPGKLEPVVIKTEEGVPTGLPVPPLPEEKIDKELQEKIKLEDLEDLKPLIKRQTQPLEPLNIVSVDERLLKEAVPLTRPRVKRTAEGQTLASPFYLPVSGGLVVKEKVEEKVEEKKPAEVPEKQRPARELEARAVGEEVKPKYEPYEQYLNVELLVYRKEGEDGYFLVRLTPKYGQKGLAAMNKDVVFLLDASKSIGEDKLTRAKRGLLHALQTLNKGDRFNVVAFKARPVALWGEMQEVNSRTIEEAKAFLASLHSEGETDVYNAVLPILEVRQSFIKPFNIILVSDGRPTVGITNTTKIIAQLTESNTTGATIFTYGAGAKVNRVLLEYLSYWNRGLSVIEPEVHKLEEGLYEFCRQLQYPILMNLEANFTGLDEKEIFPKVLPDFYYYGDLRLYGRFKAGDGVFAFRLVGEIYGKKKEIVFKQKFSEAKQGDESIRKRWAYLKAYHLVGELAKGAEDGKVRDEIRMLAEKYALQLPSEWYEVGAQ